MRAHVVARAKAGFRAGVVVAALLTGVVAVAPSASAAGYPVCNTSSIAHFSNGTYSVYPYYSGNAVTCTLSQGHTGAGVRALQKNLNNCYGKNLALDGVFGSLTKSALRDVQGRIGTTVDGIYGPDTRNKMKWAHYSNETGARVSCNTFNT